MSLQTDHPTPPQDDSQTAPLLLFMITGNPGISAFYTTFLTHLHEALTADPTITAPVFTSCPSLAGFDTSRTDPHGQRAIGIQAQIRHVESCLVDAVQAVRDKARSEQEPRVVLMGHSFGAYVLLEILRRRNEGVVMTAKAVDVRAGICITPGVVDIALSKQGKLFTSMFHIPHIETVLAALAWLFTFWIPVAVLTLLVRVIDGMSPAQARVTAAFIKSFTGLRNALYEPDPPWKSRSRPADLTRRSLAREEMAVICSDEWDDKIWRVQEADVQAAKDTLPSVRLFFLFAEKDHWVADETRDQLIQARAATGSDDRSRPVMEVSRGLVHAFVNSQSDTVARKVAGYVRAAIGP